MLHSVGPDLEPNCLQGSAADDEKIAAGRQSVMYMYMHMFRFVFFCFFAVIVIYILHF